MSHFQFFETLYMEWNNYYFIIKQRHYKTFIQAWHEYFVTAFYVLFYTFTIKQWKNLVCKDYGISIGSIILT